MDDISKYIYNSKINVDLFEEKNQIISFLEKLASLSNVEFQETFGIKANYDNKFNLIADLLVLLDEEKRKFYYIKFISRNFWYIPNEAEKDLYDLMSKNYIDSTFSRVDIAHLKSLLIANHVRKYDYEAAQEIIETIIDEELSPSICYNISDFYVKTRNYDMATTFVEKAELFDYDEYFKCRLEKLSEEIELKKLGKKGHYLPKDEVNQIKLWKFLNIAPSEEEAKNKRKTQMIRMNLRKINLDAFKVLKINMTEDAYLKGNFEGKDLSIVEAYKDALEIIKNANLDLITYIFAKSKNDILKEVKKYEGAYINSSKQFKEISDINIDSYVAYDLETTGFSPLQDEILEIGAVKVINGVIETQEKFIFQELVKPNRKYIPSKISEITGIEYSIIENKYGIEIVLPKFFEFVGNLPLVGFNNKSFDNKFLEINMDKHNIKSNNSFFDILPYVQKNRDKLGLCSCNLSSVSQSLNVINEEAHRALSDALTTAKVMEKLKTLQNL